MRIRCSCGVIPTVRALRNWPSSAEPPPQIAVSLDGPSDFTGTTWQVLNAPPPSGFGAAWCDSCGTTDTEQLTARSSAWPGNTPGNFANVKFLRIHGEGDRVVIPHRQGCELAAALGPGSSNYFLYPEISPPGHIRRAAERVWPVAAAPLLPRPQRLALRALEARRGFPRLATWRAVDLADVPHVRLPGKCVYRFRSIPYRQRGDYRTRGDNRPVVARSGKLRESIRVAVVVPHAANPVRVTPALKRALRASPTAGASPSARW